MFATHAGRPAWKSKQLRDRAPFPGAQVAAFRGEGSGERSARFASGVPDGFTGATDAVLVDVNAAAALVSMCGSCRTAGKLAPVSARTGAIRHGKASANKCSESHRLDELPESRTTRAVQKCFP